MTGKDLTMQAGKAENGSGGMDAVEVLDVFRFTGKADIGVSVFALAEYEVPAYPAGRLPAELAAIPPVEPGSRDIRSSKG